VSWDSPPEVGAGLVAEAGWQECELYPAASVGMSAFAEIWNTSGRVYTVRSVALVGARNMVLSAAYTKSPNGTIVLYSVSFPLDDPVANPGWSDASRAELVAAFAELRPLGDESTLPSGVRPDRDVFDLGRGGYDFGRPRPGYPENQKPEGDTELYLVVRLVDVSQPGMFEAARVVVRDEESGQFFTVPLLGRLVRGVEGRDCDDMDLESDQWPLPVIPTPVAEKI
jgi:hypothetical protein